MPRSISRSKPETTEVTRDARGCAGIIVPCEVNDVVFDVGNEGWYEAVGAVYVGVGVGDMVCVGTGAGVGVGIGAAGCGADAGIVGWGRDTASDGGV